MLVRTQQFIELLNEIGKERQENGIKVTEEITQILLLLTLVAHQLDNFGKLVPLYLIMYGTTQKLLFVHIGRTQVENLSDVLFLYTIGIGKLSVCSLHLRINLYQLPVGVGNFLIKAM